MNRPDRIFVGPSSVLTFLTNRVTQIRKNWRMHLAWRELKVLTDFWVRKLFSHRILVLRTPLLIKSPPFPNPFPQIRPRIYLRSPKFRSTGILEDALLRILRKSTIPFPTILLRLNRLLN